MFFKPHLLLGASLALAGLSNAGMRVIYGAHWDAKSVFDIVEKGAIGPISVPPSTPGAFTFDIDYMTPDCILWAACNNGQFFDFSPASLLKNDHKTPCPGSYPDRVIGMC